MMSHYSFILKNKLGDARKQPIEIRKVSLNGFCLKGVFLNSNPLLTIPNKQTMPSEPEGVCL